jgi:hypothetical protein
MINIVERSFATPRNDHRRDGEMYPMDYIAAQETHQKLSSLGIDGEGAAIGLRQLCVELNRAALLWTQPRSV